MSLLSRGHEPGFPGASTSASHEQQQQAAADPGLAEAKQGGLLPSGSTDTPLTHSLLDTMGYAHNPSLDAGTCPIANRLLYNYTGASRTLLNPLEREAIHQKAAVDSYEQAKAYIVSSLFRIKDDSFRKVACCLVADYLGTQFLSQGAHQEPPHPQPAPHPVPTPAWADQPPAHPSDPDAGAAAWAAPPQPADAPPAPPPQPSHPAPDAHHPTDAPQLAAPPPPAETAASAAAEAQGRHDAEAAAKDALAAAGGGEQQQNVHALAGAEAAAAAFLPPPPPEAHHHHHHHHHPQQHPQQQQHQEQEQQQQQQQQAAEGLSSDTFLNNHPHTHRDLPMADAAAV